ncbi:MAG TPA: polysaccharide deacetylase family protein [Gemmatimonadales bacterium]
MALAVRLRGSARAGVVINGHTLTADQIRDHVEILSRWFDFIHHDELEQRLTGPRSRPFCLLTFDDGKRNGVTQVAPQLERLGVPAVFYVVTRFLSEGAPLWFDCQAAVVRALRRVPPELEVAALKSLPLARVHERLDRACAEHRVSVDGDADDVRPMSWDEARDLHRRGFTIGAHSLHHAILTLETPDNARADIAQSIAEVSAQLGAPCRTFAFPNGNYTPDLARHALACGAHTVMTTEPLWVDRRCPRWRIPRVQLFGWQSRARIELKLAVAATGRLLVNPDGTGRRYRQSTHGGTA